MVRFLLPLLLAATLLAANFKLFLKDGTYQLVREYQVTEGRVRFYSIERSEWEEMPSNMVDLKRTEQERQARDQELKKDAEEMAAEEKFEREQRNERARIPQEPGVYLAEGQEIRTFKQAESKVNTSKGRSVLRAVAPAPVVSGKATVELEGEHSAAVVNASRPEFYMRLAHEERFGIVKLYPKKGVRVVQKWSIIPVSKEIVEEQQDVPIFRKQVDEALYKIWPEAPLEPGEYAVIEFTEGKGNVQSWDFAYHPAAAR
jgi:hypothetical protein